MRVIKSYNPFFRQFIFLGVLFCVCVLIFSRLEFFLSAFLGGIALYVLLRESLFKLTEQKKWKPWAASLLLIVGTSAILLAIGYIIFELIAGELENLNTSGLLENFKKLPEKINHILGFKAVTPDMVSRYSSALGEFISTLFNTAYSFVANLFMMLVVLYFMLANARRMEKMLSLYLPFRGRSREIVKEEFKSMIFSNALGIPLVMLSQAIASALIYWLLGVEDVLFWAFITAVCGLIPMVGTVIITLPMGLYMISMGNTWPGILVIILGILVIANVDNLCRIVLMKKITNTHPLIVIFGVIIGIPLFGFWGIIFGPLLISMSLLLINIYFHEYHLISPKDEQQEQEESSK